MNTHKRGWLIAAIALLIAAPTFCQEVLREHVAPATLMHPYLVKPAADIDGDGVADYFVSYSMTGTAGAVEVFSGVSGEYLWRLRTRGSLGLFGRSASTAGDHDGDGVPDIVVGAGGAYGNGGFSVGKIYVLSGPSGDQIAVREGCCQDYNLGHDVAGVGDVNGDGYEDFIASSSTNVQLFLGPDATPDRIHPGFFHANVAGVGDTNGDGVPDYLVGAPSNAVTGVAVLFSGLDGSELWCGSGYNSSSKYGNSVSGAGDLDQDGFADFVVGIGRQGDVEDANSAIIYSGFDGSSLLVIVNRRLEPALGSNVAERGEIVSGGFDVNGDGVLDVLVGERERPPGSQFSVGTRRIVSGATGTTLWKRWYEPGYGLPKEGASLLGDLDGDGYSEWGVIYESDDDPLWKVRIYRGAPGDGVRTCPGQSNSLGAPAELIAPFGISVAGLFRLQVEPVPAAETGIFFYGSPVPAAPFGDGTLCIGGELFRAGSPVLSVDDEAAYKDIDLGAPPMNGTQGSGGIAAGITWRFQYWYRDPAGAAGFNLSDALDITFAQ